MHRQAHPRDGCIFQALNHKKVFIRHSDFFCVMMITGFSDKIFPSTGNKGGDIDFRIIDFIHTGIVLIGKDFRVLMINGIARELLGEPPSKDMDKITCHILLHQRQDPCPECPIISGGSLISVQRPLTIKRGGGADRFLKEHFCTWEENYIITLNDVTREILALRKTDLARKELQAKNILVERHRREALEEKKRLNDLLDLLPESLVLVNNSFRIERKNRAAGENLPAGETTSCFELFGKDSPCNGCPAKDGFQKADGKKTSHLVAGRYFTEEVIKSPDGNGGLLLFRDTTRQIQLIEKIREQQDTITRKNDILSSLVSFQGMTQTENDPKVVIDFFVDVFMPVCKTSVLAVVINDIRPGSLWFSTQRGFSDAQISAMTKACLSNRGGKCLTAEFNELICFTEGIREIEIHGGDGRRVGLAFITNFVNKEDENLIQLFFEPLGAYVHNRLLMRQLEERANTDPLTGLYNRGYLDGVLLEEKKKYVEYEIPYAIVAADVNRLKQANDEYGHEAGDKLILTVAQKLKSAIREADCVARTGGDEFIILLANTTHASAQEVVKRFAETVFKDTVMDVGNGQKFPVTVSFGASGVDFVGPDELLKDADRRMYESKQTYYESHKRYR